METTTQLQSLRFIPQISRRINDLIEQSDYMQFSPDDWKAIYYNLISANGVPEEGTYTDDQILSEIEAFYNN